MQHFVIFLASTLAILDACHWPVSFITSTYKEIKIVINKFEKKITLIYFKLLLIRKL